MEDDSRIYKMTEENLELLIKGLGASPGRASGIVKVVFSPQEAETKINEGDILVTIATDPSFTPFMKKASAIVTDVGGVLAHAAIVSRELGIPCVVGCEKATEVLKDGMKVIVDGLEGLIWAGKE
jgi:pyruvate,water dikinase